MIRKLILAELKRNIGLQNLNDKELDTLIFRRHNNIRLTFRGYKYLSAIATCHIYTHDNSFKAKHILALSGLKFPYYLSNKFFILFSEEDALLVSLHGDVSRFLEYSRLFQNNS